jgi:hypothetical protein
VYRHSKFGEKDRISEIKSEMSCRFYKEYIDLKEQMTKEGAGGPATVCPESEKPHAK